METPFLALLIILLVMVMGGILAIIYLLRKPGNSTDELSSSLQNLSHAIQNQQTQTAVLAERLSSLEPLTQTVGGVQVEIAKSGAIAHTLVEATAAIRNELQRTTESLSEMKAHAKARQDVEQRTAESVRRLEAVIGGTQTRGAAGENILEALLAKLPAEWQVRDFRVGNKFVEFGLRLPNNLILPIDSKWSAAHLVEQLAACQEPDEALRLKSQIEAVVMSKAKEVRKYIDPALTVNFGIAAVPDAVFDLCIGIQIEVFRQNVVLVSHSMFVPYLLLVFQTVLRTSQNIDVERLQAYLQTAQESVGILQEELEGRFSRAITMLGNSRGDMSVHLSKVSSGLTSLQLGAERAGSLTEPFSNDTNR